MPTDQALPKFALFWLVLVVWILGCDDSAKKPPPATDRIADQSSQASEAKRAPRSLREFQEVLAEGRVGSIQGEVIFLGRKLEVPEIPVTLDKHVCGEGPKKS